MPMAVTVLLAAGTCWVWVASDRGGTSAALALDAQQVIAADHSRNLHAAAGETDARTGDEGNGVPANVGAATTRTTADGAAGDAALPSDKSPGPAIGFVVYATFLSASECQADPRFNPRGVALAADELEVLQRLLDESNRTLAALQGALQLRTEAWGKLLIENGLSDTEKPGAELRAVPQTTRVGVLSNGRLATVTVRAGDNAELDQLNADLLSFVRTAHEQIHEFFE